MSDTLIAALIGIPLALASYWVQASLARKAETAKFERDNKREVYNLFLTALVGMGTTKVGTADNSQFSRQLLDARARIILYGSSEVVESLSQFWVHPVLDNDHAYESLTQVVGMMRRDNGAAISENFGEHVKTILFEKFSKSGTLKSR